MSDEQTQEIERLRHEIARTRADMDRTLAELEDRVSPSRIAERQTDKVRSRWHDARDRVMGAADGNGNGHMGQRISDTAHGAQESLQHAPERLESATQGNPLAAGLIAFGLGALAGSLMPASDAEKRLASELRDEFEEPMRGELRDAMDETRSEMKEHAQHAIDETRETAQHAMERTRDDATQRAEHVRDTAQHEAETVQAERQGQHDQPPAPRHR